MIIDMKRDTLLDFFDDFADSPADFLVYDDGYRSRSHTYREVAAASRRMAIRLADAGLGRGDKLLIWSENRPEWVVAFWACLSTGVVLVPVDYRASSDLLERIHAIVESRLVLIGRDVRLPGGWEPGVPVWRIDQFEWPDEAPAEPAAAPDVAAGDLAEIIFTSGATAEPKGVTITHRNVLANIVPVEREVMKYRKYARPFAPIRFLNLLPLSHMFGQAMATFIPPMLHGTVVFTRGYNPNEIIRQVRARRVSVLVCVPKMLDVLRDHVVRVAPEAGEPAARGGHWLRRWWRYRRVHRLFGWKFWCFIVGAAPLDPDLEAFWSKLGFLVVQGYGLTETAPIVTLNHPLHARRGSVGRPIGGVEVKIAPDGEILVRGNNVTAGYYKAEAETAAVFEDGWLHTGDVGRFDEEGRLVVRGRKKEMIVTAEGLNVFPEDVERVLNEQPGVRDSAVVGVPSSGEERVHAVLLLEPEVEADEIVRRANSRLEPHQRVRGASVWPGDELPRTEGTRKLKRRELKGWVAGAAARAPASARREERVEDIVARFAGRQTIAPDTTLDELGVSSLERVELMLALEERFQTTIDEASFAAARTVKDLQALVERPGELRAPRPAGVELIAFPRWNRRLPAAFLRRISLPTWILPPARFFARLRLEGLEHLARLRGPVVLAANHQSHMDTPAILAALPPRWRYRVAPAMAKEFFDAHFHPERHSRRARLTSGVNYYLSSLFFNAFPMPQREAGTRQTLRYIGELASAGYSILIFPEGKRTERGEIIRFQPGVGMIAARLNLPVVPVRLEGLDRVLHQSWKMARRGPVRITFGPPLMLAGDDYAALAKQVEDAVRAL
jgi:long-chain acyl-CoA synthetase